MPDAAIEVTDHPTAVPAEELLVEESLVEESLVEESLVEEVSIDGMCGVY
jgi:mycofactocin precursor